MHPWKGLYWFFTSCSLRTFYSANYNSFFILFFHQFLLFKMKIFLNPALTFEFYKIPETPKSALFSFLFLSFKNPFWCVWPQGNYKTWWSPTCYLTFSIYPHALRMTPTTCLSSCGLEGANCYLLDDTFCANFEIRTCSLFFYSLLSLWELVVIV